MHRWGLVPAWAKSVSVGSRHINARAETIAASPAFRTSFIRRRCLIPADGFYEWLRDGRRKQPFLIRPVDAETSAAPLVFAGIWCPWREPASGEWLLTAAVVTTAANETVGRLHNRMPVILGNDEWPLWLDPTITDGGLLQDLLQPAPDDLLELVPVSPLVNNVNNEGPDLVVPLPATAAPQPSLTLVRMSVSSARRKLGRRFDPDELRAIKRLWIRHSIAEDARDIEGLVSTITADGVYEIVPTGETWHGHDGVRAWYKALFEAFPDNHFDLIDIVVGPQGVFEVARLTATNLGRGAECRPRGCRSTSRC